LTKPNKNNLDLNILYVYLKQLAEFVRKLNVKENLEGLIYEISLYLKHQFVATNRMVFKYMDKGDFFYILLKGKIQILIPTEQKVNMTIEDYIRYVVKLKRNDEGEIVKLVMEKNKNIFKIDDVLDNWFDENGRTFYHKKSILYNELSKEIDEIIKIANSKKFKSEINDSLVSVEEYINKTNPDICIKDTESERKTVIVMAYSPVHVLYKGDTFGEGALESISGRRNASLITLEDTHLGILDKKTYYDCLKESIEQSRKNKLHFLATTKLLENMNKVIFQKKFINYFSPRTITRNTKIIEEGEKPSHIYIIKEGEFEIYTKKSTFQLNNIIQKLGGVVRESEADIYDMNGKRLLISLDDPKYRKFMNEKKALKVCIAKEREVVGLSDFIFQDTYCFTVECTSSEGEVYQIASNVSKS
jgi:CRP-like cAMP-binding protein